MAKCYVCEKTKESVNMKNEYFINYENLTSQSICDYINVHTEASEITCLIPDDDEQAEQIEKIDTLLRQNNFRHLGKQLIEGKIMIVFRWFRDLNDRFEDMSSFFNRRADYYDLLMSTDYPSFEVSLANIASSIVPTNKDIYILDLGCGTGTELKYVFQKLPNAHVVCIDMSDKMLEKLCSKYIENINNIEVICASYTSIYLGIEKYDYVIACNTLHHLFKEDKFLLYKKIKTSLKKNGLLLISDYVVNDEEEINIRNRYLQLVKDGTISKDKLYHIDLPLSLNSEKELLDGAGFNNVSTKRIGENGIEIIAS